MLKQSHKIVSSEQEIKISSECQRKMIKDGRICRLHDNKTLLEVLIWHQGVC
jgi:hypothetical protein